jgi:hypothetical protein
MCRTCSASLALVHVLAHPAHTLCTPVLQVLQIRVNPKPVHAALPQLQCLSVWQLQCTCYKSVSSASSQDVIITTWTDHLQLGRVNRHTWCPIPCTALHTLGAQHSNHHRMVAWGSLSAQQAAHVYIPRQSCGRTRFHGQLRSGLSHVGGPL